jgi:hypothetical protein
MNNGIPAPNKGQNKGLNFARVYSNSFSTKGMRDEARFMTVVLPAAFPAAPDQG